MLSACYNAIIKDLIERYPVLKICEMEVVSAIECLCSAFRSGNKLLVCGNGGSASDSEHIVGELMKSFKMKRPISNDFKNRYLEANGETVPAWLEGSLPAISLVSQTSLGTAFANDESAVGVFAQQVYGYGLPGDALLCISTSGNSENVVAAAKIARAMGVSVVSMTGSSLSKLSTFSDICIRVPVCETFAVQELHLPVYHAICASVEMSLFCE